MSFNSEASLRYESLIKSEENDIEKSSKRLKYLFLPAKLFLVVVDATIALWGIDFGFYCTFLNSEDIFVTPYSLAFVIWFIVGCLLFSYIQTYVAERIVFPICYVLYLVGTIIFFIYTQSTVLSRSLQGLSLGLLLPWSIECRITLTSPYTRYIIISFLAVIFFSSWFIGLLIRMVGGVAKNIIMLISACLICLFGLTSVFATRLPIDYISYDLRHVRKLVKNIKPTNDNNDQDSVILSKNDDILFSSVFQSCEMYLPNEDIGDQTDSLLASYIREREMIFLLGWRSYLKGFKNVIFRCLLCILCITCFPFASMSTSLPHLGHYIHQWIGNSLVCNCILFFFIIICSIVIHSLLHKYQSVPILFVTSIIVASSCLIVFIIGICEYWININDFYVLIWLKFLSIFIALITFMSGCLPILFIRTIEVLPMLAYSYMLGHIMIAIVLIIIGVAWINRQLMIVVKSTIHIYFIPFLLLTINAALCKHMIDYSSYTMENIDVLVGYVV